MSMAICLFRLFILFNVLFSFPYLFILNTFFFSWSSYQHNYSSYLPFSRISSIKQFTFKVCSFFTIVCSYFFNDTALLWYISNWFWQSVSSLKYDFFLWFSLILSDMASNTFSPIQFLPSDTFNMLLFLLMRVASN